VKAQPDNKPTADSGQDIPPGDWCGEPFPCPLGRAYIVSVVDADGRPLGIHLELTRDELATIVEALRAFSLPEFANRINAVALDPSD
jgi:hypothetical protein